MNDLVRLRNHKNEAKLAKLTMIFTFFVSSSPWKRVLDALTHQV